MGKIRWVALVLANRIRTHAYTRPLKSAAGEAQKRLQNMTRDEFIQAKLFMFSARRQTETSAAPLSCVVLMTKDLSYCFEPIADLNSEILILGSMPGRASLEAGQYYARCRNSFWKIMAVLLSFDPESSYEARVKALQSAGVALWDVLQSCRLITLISMDGSHRRPRGDRDGLLMNIQTDVQCARGGG